MSPSRLVAIPSLSHLPPFVLAFSAPHAMLLAGFECPVQTLLDNRTLLAYGLGLFNLCESGSGIALGKEQFRIRIKAGSFGGPRGEGTDEY